MVTARLYAIPTRMSSDKKTNMSGSVKNTESSSDGGLPVFTSMPSTRLLGVRIDCVDDSYILARMRAALEGSAPPLTVTYVHFDTLLLARERTDIRDALDRADIVFPDGIALHAALLLQRRDATPRYRSTSVNTAAIRLCAQLGGRLLCIGGTPAVASSLTEALQQLGYAHSDILVMDGWTDHDPGEFATRILALNPSMIALGMGGTKQLRYLHQLACSSHASVHLAVGGLFDSLSRHTWGPPSWIWSAGFEWLIRLVQEPRRLWRRYLLRFPRFVILVLQELMRAR